MENHQTAICVRGYVGNPGLSSAWKLVTKLVTNSRQREYYQHHAELLATFSLLAEVLFFTVRKQSPLRFGMNSKKRV